MDLPDLQIPGLLDPKSRGSQNSRVPDFLDPGYPRSHIFPILDPVNIRQKIVDLRLFFVIELTLQRECEWMRTEPISQQELNFAKQGYSEYMVRPKEFIQTPKQGAVAEETG